MHPKQGICASWQCFECEGKTSAHLDCQSFIWWLGGTYSCRSWPTEKFRGQVPQIRFQILMRPYAAAADVLTLSRWANQEIADTLEVPSWICMLRGFFSSLLAFTSSFSRTSSGCVSFFLQCRKDNKPDYYMHISALTAIKAKKKGSVNKLNLIRRQCLAVSHQ